MLMAYILHTWAKTFHAASSKKQQLVLFFCFCCLFVFCAFFVALQPVINTNENNTTTTLWGWIPGEKGKRKEKRERERRCCWLEGNKTAEAQAAKVEHKSSYQRQDLDSKIMYPMPGNLWQTRGCEPNVTTWDLEATGGWLVGSSSPSSLKLGQPVVYVLRVKLHLPCGISSAVTIDKALQKGKGAREGL